MSDHRQARNVQSPRHILLCSQNDKLTHDVTKSSHRHRDPRHRLIIHGPPDRQNRKPATSRIPRSPSGRPHQHHHDRLLPAKNRRFDCTFRGCCEERGAGLCGFRYVKKMKGRPLGDPCGFVRRADRQPGTRPQDKPNDRFASAPSTDHSQDHPPNPR
jgi:hypothetical protein